METVRQPCAPRPAAGSQGLPRGRRLRLRREIRRVLGHGFSCRGSWLRARFLAAPAPPGRLLISVRKAYGCAPARNRFKRWVREALRTHPLWGRLPWDVCFLGPAKPVAGLCYQAVQQEVGALLHAAAKRHGR